MCMHECEKEGKNSCENISFCVIQRLREKSVVLHTFAVYIAFLMVDMISVFSVHAPLKIM